MYIGHVRRITHFSVDIYSLLGSSALEVISFTLSFIWNSNKNGEEEEA